MATKPTPTTEISIPANNETLVSILTQQYGHFDAGEARAALETAYSTVWNEEEFAQQFKIESVHPPYVTVVELPTKQRGTAMYLDSPRFYFLFQPDVKPV